MDSTVRARTAPAPQGPWSDTVAIHYAAPIEEGSSIYAAIPHTYFDNSGKTLVVTFTNSQNTIQAIRVVSDSFQAFSFILELTLTRLSRENGMVT